MKIYFADLFLVSVGLILNISLLSAQTPELILPIGHSDAIRYANYSPDGKRITQKFK